MQLFFHGQHGLRHGSRARAPEDDGDGDDDAAERGGRPANTNHAVLDYSTYL